MYKSSSSPFFKTPDHCANCYEQFEAYSHQRDRQEFTPPSRYLKLEFLGDNLFSPAQKSSIISSLIKDDKYAANYNFLQDHHDQKMEDNCELSFQTQFPEELGLLSIYVTEEKIGKRLFNSPYSQRRINFDDEIKDNYQSSTSRKEDINDLDVWSLLNSKEEYNNFEQSLQNEIKLGSKKTKSTKEKNQLKANSIIAPPMFIQKTRKAKKKKNLIKKSKKIMKKKRVTAISSPISTSTSLRSPSSSSFHEKQNPIEERLTRKIVKNFGKAIAAFACSVNAKPLIMQFVHNDVKKYSRFLQFVYEIKDTIEGNRRLKLLLQHQPEDNLQTRINKDIFKYSARIFMQGHVYKWLWNSHVENKDLHAKLIGKVRIRIENPDLLDHLTN